MPRTKKKADPEAKYKIDQEITFEGRKGKIVDVVVRHLDDEKNTPYHVYGVSFSKKEFNKDIRESELIKGKYDRD